MQDNFVYIENFKMVKSYLDNSQELSKYRSKSADSPFYSVNAIISNKIGGVWMVSFLAPERLAPKKWILMNKKEIIDFKHMFSEILKKDVVYPFFLKFSNKIDDNIFLNSETVNFLNKIFTEVENFKEGI